MAFSRMAKGPKAEPAPEASADAARKAAIDEAKRKAVEDARWKDSHTGFGSGGVTAPTMPQAQSEADEEKMRQERIARSKAEAAKRAMASGGGGFGGGGAPSGGGFGSGSKQEFSWKKQTPAPAAAGKGAGKGGRGGANLPSYDAIAGGGGNLPSHDDCEQAISAMVSRTTAGMKEGLQGLGLPEYPLHFVPGRELKLCGHDVREVINEMIHAWMTEEKEEFYKVLVRIKGIVANPILEEGDMIDQTEGYAEKKATMEAAKAVARDMRSAVTAVDEDDDDDEVIEMDAKPKGDKPAAPKPEPPKEVSTPAPAPEAKPEPDDFYKLLGVDPTATLQEIRLKFRSLVVTEHPEKGGDPKKFAKLNKAYSVLSDSEKRKAFDAQRLAALEVID